MPEWQTRCGKPEYRSDDRDPPLRRDPCRGCARVRYQTMGSLAGEIGNGEGPPPWASGGLPTNDQAFFFRGGNPAGERLAMASLGGERSAVLGAVKDARAGFASTAAFASASLTAPARSALAVARSGRRDGRFDRTKGWLFVAQAAMRCES